ncbi:hypothetical protein C1645_830127 [Glomus cerebriforme]|uniref:Uncharacterized protein n=1 Tax=Glomus cerebriforme TaxID=658196 RepID=A0A397SPN0_9GLOM|nr:hypothetical protein C1645_830127 [Glomus cerebriforme]
MIFITKDHSIFVWNIEDIDEGQLKSDYYRSINGAGGIEKMCVSDDKKLVYIYPYFHHIAEDNQSEFILCSKVRGRHYREEDHKIIYFYSTKTKNNKWMCKRMYKVPEGFVFISISKYDKLYVPSNNYVYELVIHTKKSRKIFNNDEIINVVSILKLFLKDIRVGTG